MKKIYLTSIFLLTAGVMFSQVKYTSTGKFGVGTTNPLSLFTVNSDGDANKTFYVYETNKERMATFFLANPTGDYAITLSSKISIGSGTGNKLVAGNFQAYSPSYNTKLSFGIRGTAGKGYDGKNYGVYGSLIGTRDGAAVVGVLNAVEPNINGIYAGYFNGDVHITGDLTVDGDYPGLSDLDIKKDIRYLNNDVLEKLASLQTIKYKMIVPKRVFSDTATIRTVDSTKIEIYNRDRIGLIAQELQMVYPELVTVGNDGHLRIKYLQIIPLLVKAINSQQDQIGILELKIETVSNKKGLLSNIDNSFMGNESSLLYQNSPNPFNDITEIKYFIDEMKSSSSINIFDLRGKQLDSFDITSNGEGVLIVPASMFESGMYIYSLIVDEIVIDSKQMMLTD